MLIFADNIRYLRTGREKSQQQVATDLQIQRDRYAKYEGNKADPPLEVLQKIARYYHVSIDILLSVDLRKVPLDELLKLEDNRILLPVKTDLKGENVIEIVPHKARMGYAMGYADPEFIESLQHISLPFLRNGKFRAFPGSGDSMPPHKDSSFIIGRYVEQLGDVRDGKTYILVTRNEGIVYKRLNKNGKNAMVALSDNSAYKPYEIKYSEILEIWEYACSIAMEEYDPDDLNPETIKGMLQDLRNELREIKQLKSK
ncbi:MAG: LexA family transcriptional regulator [Flavobacterium sp.]|nr:MAG: LexA family transcriptional regulator [Flavobacterium sp.]